MKVDFMEGANMPIDPLQAAKLSSEVGYQVGTKMPIKTKWKEYNVEGNQHFLPEFFNDLKVGHEMNLFCNCAIPHLFISPL